MKSRAPTLLAIAAGAPASVALAHPRPRQSSPAPNAVVASTSDHAPTWIEIRQPPRRP